MLDARKLASTWYKLKKKHPKMIQGSHELWRWVLLDPPTAPLGPTDLPKEVFDLLESDKAQPWLFDTVFEAMQAAKNAAAKAIKNGWKLS